MIDAVKTSPSPPWYRFFSDDVRPCRSGGGPASCRCSDRVCAYIPLLMKYHFSQVSRKYSQYSCSTKRLGTKSSKGGQSVGQVLLKTTGWVNCNYILPCHHRRSLTFQFKKNKNIRNRKNTFFKLGTH